MESGGAPQLVGMNCTLCDKTIGSIAAGKFCAKCSCPVHHKCIAQKSLRRREECRECGSPNEKQEAILETEREVVTNLERDVRYYQGIRHIMMGFGWIIAAVAVSIFCTGISMASGGGGNIIIGSGLGLFGLGQIVFGFVRLTQKGPTNPSEPGT